MNKDNILKQLSDCYLYGDKGMIEYPKDYSIFKNSINDNSIELHELFKGVIESKPALQVHHITKALFAENQLKYISD